MKNRVCGFCGKTIQGVVYLLQPGGVIRLCHVCKLVTDTIFQSARIRKTWEANQ